MIFPEYKTAYWDRYKAFHMLPHPRREWMDNSPMVLFDTGEFMVIRDSWAPGTRKVYEDLNVQIVSTTDDDCPALFAPLTDKPVAKTHLNWGGQQILWIDHDHKMAVGLQSLASADWKRGVPERLRTHAEVYYYGAHAPPLGHPVTVTKPRKYDPEIREASDDLLRAARVWLEMCKDQGQKLGSTVPWDKPLNRIGRSEGHAFGDLTTGQRLMLANHGFQAEYGTDVYTHFAVA